MLKNITKKLSILTVATLALVGSSVSVFAADTQVPTAPILSMSNRSGYDVQYSWSASTDNVGVDHYVMYADITSPYTSWTQNMGYISSSQSRVLSINTTDGLIYRFYVKAYDAAGNESAASNIREFNTDTTEPTAPGNLTCTSKTSTSVTLDWDTSIDDFTGICEYWVWQDGTCVGFTDAATTLKVITGLTPGTTYTFEVGAIDNGYDGNQSPFSTITVTTNP